MAQSLSPHGPARQSDLGMNVRRFQVIMPAIPSAPAISGSKPAQLGWSLMAADSDKRTAKIERQQIKQAAGHIQQASGQIAASTDRSTQLAADRTMFAAERTYAAWVRTGLASLASGMAAKAVLKDVLPEL